MKLGEGYRPIPAPAPIVDIPAPPTMEERILLALLDLKQALQPQPPAPVFIDPPDLSAIVTAVTGLKQQATPAEIAEAIVTQLQPAPATNNSSDAVMAKVADALLMLEHRLQGITYQAYGGGAVSLSPGQSIIANDPAGAFKYYTQAAGNGTITVLSGERIRGITGHWTAAGTITIFGGTAVPVPANTTFFDSPEGLTGDGTSTIVYSGSDSCYVRTLV